MTNETLTSKLLFEKLKEFEGCRLEAYQDVAGVWTIGYGHTENVMKGDTYSQWWAEESLRKDIALAERQVLKLKVCKTQGQLDALVSFVFNLGIGRLKSSTLLKKVRCKKCRQKDIQNEFLRWVYGDGKRLTGLVKRRKWEAQRFFDETPTLEEIKLFNK